MIYAAVNHISTELNHFLKRNYERSDDVVVVSSLLDLNGGVASNIDNKIVVCVANIETERVRHANSSVKQGGDYRAILSNEPLQLNVYLMVAASFSSGNYSEGLKYLSSALNYFQMNPVFNHQTTPALDERIDRLGLDLVNLDFNQLSNMWGILSSRYLPSVMYKVRMVTIDSDAVMAELPNIGEARPYIGNAPG